MYLVNLVSGSPLPPHKPGSQEIITWKFLLGLSGLRTQHCLCEDVSSIPGLAHQIKDPVLPQSYGVVAASPETKKGAGEAQKKKKKKKKKKEGGEIIT